MQVDPIEPTLKPNGTVCLKLTSDTLLSSFAFKFNLRRYIEGPARGVIRAGPYTRPHLCST